VLAPTLFITQEAVTEKLYRFVEEGGCLLLTNRSGVKDAYNKCIMSSLPTVFAELVGVHVEEYDAIGQEKQTLAITDSSWSRAFGGEKTLCTRWCDLLAADTARVMAVYQEGFYAGTPAVTRNSYGSGTAYYVGTVLERKAYSSLAKVMASEMGLDFIDNLPTGVEVTYRQKGEQTWRFVFNNTMEEQNVLEEGTLAPFEMKIRKL
jgi:beta-galactosidase